MRARVSHLDAGPAAVVAAPFFVTHLDAVPALRFERVDCLTA